MSHGEYQCGMKRLEWLAKYETDGRSTHANHSPTASPPRHLARRAVLARLGLGVESVMGAKFGIESYSVMAGGERALDCCVALPLWGRGRSGVVGDGLNSGATAAAVVGVIGGGSGPQLETRQSPE